MSISIVKITETKTIADKSGGYSSVANITNSLTELQCLI